MRTVHRSVGKLVKVVGFAPVQATDIVAWLLGERPRAMTSDNCVIENKPAGHAAWG